MSTSSRERARGLRANDAASRSLCVAGRACEWLDRVASTPQEIERICAETGAPPELALHALDADELARVDHHPGGAILVVMRVPSADHVGDEPIRTIPLSAILIGDRIVTLLPAELGVVSAARASLVRMRSESRAGVLIALVLASADQYLTHLRAIEAAVSVLEAKLQASSRNEELRRLLAHQKSLVHFRTGIGSNLIMLERLGRDTRIFSEPADLELLDDALVEMRQAAEMTAVSSTILGEMMHALASVISNDLNVVMKIMTALMIVIAVPSMVAAFYGMNVELPGQHHGRAFLIVAGAAFAAAGTIVVVFRRARWL